jgi:sugar lactone lactonase YvrE
MLGVTDLFGNEENDATANKAYAIGEVFTSNGKLYRATAAIAQDGAIVTDGTGVNCAEISIANDYVKKTDYATDTTAGLVKVNIANGLYVGPDGDLWVNRATSTLVKDGTNQTRAIVPSV